MTIRLALIDETGEGASVARLASRLPDAAFTVVADTIAVAWKQVDAFDAIVHLPRKAPEAALARQIAAAGKHWLFDGSLAWRVAPARQIAELFRAAGLRLMTGPPVRFSPAVRAVKESVASGKLGAPGLVRIHHWTSAGRLSLIELLMPQIDLVGWIMGASPQTVFARVTPPIASPSPPAPEWEYVQLHLGFAENAMAVVDVTSSLPKGDDYCTLSVIGSTGAAYADDHRNVQLHYGGGHPAGLRTGQGDFPRLAQLQEFVAAIRQQRDPNPNGMDAVRTLDVIEAVYESVQTGQRATPQSTLAEAGR